MKHLKQYEIDSSKVTKIHNVEYILDIKIVIYKKSRYSFGLFDSDSAEGIYFSEKAYTLDEVYIAALRKINEIL